ncbi:MAG TPA: FAD-dependent thymidylate synthase [Aquifex aeolicus]|uniref:FAD-dependent thymidylate synthase n=1 Tax=Aquifex aeolicus TaxID=63363 RepID=A0A9D1CFI1_AQUAO|nr:FAD-dependent thymidylate synthase [Aquificales bacterium]HIP86404.1 FAD-dependent thymidylate synthase [Aquifex sp.]HIP98167.1 FAD-dependent thymidylate synthase [Aquifex aeolicus]HIQ26574.1 FAD-dependent thymidylate synthase [Aquifex aeolicus]
MPSIKDFFSWEDFKETFPLTAIGARVCYSKKSLEELLKEPKVSSPRERAEFLSKLANWKHYSVFAHSFAYKKVGREKAIYLGAKYFKTYWDERKPDYIGVSLRHYLEELTPDEQKEVFENLSQLDVQVKPLAQEGNVTLLGGTYKGFGYFVFYIDGISRVATHQLVRHTTLNFSQRSQRYATEKDNYSIVPPSYDERAKDLFESWDKLANNLYRVLTEDLKIPKEDARFILPHGRRSSIVVSAPTSWLLDFLKKRTERSAQWEIRNTAQTMLKLLKPHLRKIEFPLSF